MILLAASYLLGSAALVSPVVSLDCSRSQPPKLCALSQATMDEMGKILPSQVAIGEITKKISTKGGVVYLQLRLSGSWDQYTPRSKLGRIAQDAAFREIVYEFACRYSSVQQLLSSGGLVSYYAVSHDWIGVGGGFLTTCQRP